MKYSNGVVSTNEQKAAELEAYQERVDTFLRLSATKVIGLEDVDAADEGIAPQEYEANRLTAGCNVLLYGVPGRAILSNMSIANQAAKLRDSFSIQIIHTPISLVKSYQQLMIMDR